MRRSVLAVLPQLLRGSAATSAPASYQVAGRLQSLRSYADDANLKVWGGRFGAINRQYSRRCGAHPCFLCAAQKTALYDFHVAHGGKHKQLQRSLGN